MPLPPPLTSLHLLRSLLRAASYLPDAHARRFVRRYIVNRFRAYQPRQNASPSLDAKAVEKRLHHSFRRRNDAIIESRTRAMQRRGHKGLNLLRRAVLGDLPCLRKVLFFTYGRLGRRKYELLDRLLRPDAPGDVAATEPPPLQKLYHSTRRCLAFFDAPRPNGADYIIPISDRYSRLKAVVASQARTGVTLGLPIRQPHLRTPMRNIWQRPMPIKRARNNVRRWYAETMTRLLPPLPADEWDAIQAMVDGTKHIGFARPRTPVQTGHVAPVDDVQERAQHITKALALEKPSKADQLAAARARHPCTITPRSMRRLYASLLTYCCKLEWDEQRGQWSVRWGSDPARISPRVYSTSINDSLFAGVDHDGKLIRETSPSPPAAEKKVKRKHVMIPFFIDYLPESHPLRVQADEFRQRKNAEGD